LIKHQQFIGMTAPKRREMSEIPHPHVAHLPYLPELPTVIVAVLHVNFWIGHFSGGGRCRFNLLYNIGGGGLDKVI